MREDGVVYYLAGDHLGTTSVVLNENGTVHSQARHYPYGEVRWFDGTLPTDYRFTGQRDVGLGLYHMGARFYDSYLARWLSPDTIVPEPGNPQDFNRYSYVRNNPLVYVDPSGHTGCIVEDDDEVCRSNFPDELPLDEPPGWLIELLIDPEFWEALFPSAGGVYIDFTVTLGCVSM